MVAACQEDIKDLLDLRDVSVASKVKAPELSAGLEVIESERSSWLGGGEYCQELLRS